MGKRIIDTPLKNVIIEILGTEGMSINSLSKALEEKRGIKVHRLYLTGYLVAMKDMGMLRERDIKPAKVFSVIPSKKRDMYMIIGERAKRVNPEESADVCLYVLHRLFNRPIFQRELSRAGVGTPRYGRKIVGDERKRALEILTNAGFTIPRNNSAYIPERDYENEYNQILGELIAEAFNVKNLMNRRGQQKKLDDE